MAAITTLKSGLASDPLVWSTGATPVSTDTVTITKIGTAVNTLTTNTAGYAIGATAITLNAGGVAGSFVVGESVRFGTDINIYNITAWNSATNVLTVTPLVVAIPASATTVYNLGCVVTLDGSYTWGNDVAAGITLNGTLRHSRTVNSQLTIRGGITSGTTTFPNNVHFDRGYEADPIPSGVTATLILNDSAVLASGKYNINWQWGWRWTEWGATKKEATRLNGAIAIGAVSCVVDDATGWAVGDRLMLADTGTGATFAGEYATITSVAGTTIGFAATTFAHKDRGVVANLTRNVRCKPSSASFPCQLRINLTSLGLQQLNMEDRYQFGWSHHEDMGIQGSQLDALAYDTRDQQLATAPTARHVGFATYVTNFAGVALGNIGLFNTPGVYNPYIFQKCVICSTNNNGQTGRTGLRVEIASADISDTWILSGNTGTFSFFNTPYVTVTGGGDAVGGGQFWIDRNANATFTNVDIGAHLNFTMNGSYDFTTFTNCRIGKGAGNGSISQSPPFNLTGSGNVATGYVFENCDLPVTTYTETQLATTQWLTARSDALIKFNKPNGEDRYEWKRKNGTMYSENSVISRSNRAIRFAQSSNLGPEGLYYSFPVPMVASVPVTVIGRLRKDSGYGSSNRPTATLSGQGSTAATFTMTNSVDTYEVFTLTVTPTTTGFGTLKVQGKSANGTTATPVNFYVDGITFAPFNSFSRHYGKIFDFNIYTTNNPFITETVEATVGAYTGITINHTTDTITLTSNHSIKEVYDYCFYNLSQTANLGEAEFFTTADGVNYTSTYNLVLNGGNLTGTGNLNLGTKNLTITAGEVSTIFITANNGNTGFLNVSGLAGHSIILMNNAGAQVEYNASVTGTYSFFTSNTATGTWKFISKKAGYEHQIITFTPATGGAFNFIATTTQKLTPEGIPMYTGTTSALVTVSFTGTTQATIDIGNGIAVLQSTFDETEVALATNAGMLWIASGKDDVSIFNSASGDYLFMTDKWRLRRASAGDNDATLQAFAISTEGVIVDGTNGPVQFLTSDTATTIATAVRVEMERVGGSLEIAKQNAIRAANNTQP